MDNIQILADDPMQLQSSMLTAEVFLDMMDLQLDQNKCFSWGNNSDHRRLLRGLGHTVRLHARDLGAQMTFSRVLRAETSECRVQSIQHFWAVLKKSPCQNWFKIQVIRGAAWPKALHACENRKASLTTTGTLRSKAMAALGWKRAGASPWIRWSFSLVPDADPEFYQIWSILRTFHRMMTTFEELQHRWSQFVSTPVRHGQGPFHSLVLVLEQLRWQWHADLTLDVGFLCIPWQDLHLALLRLLAIDAWYDFVSRQVSHRLDFQGMTSIDHNLSFQHSPLDLDRGEQELLATIQDGTFYTSWQLAKLDPTISGFCDRCNVEDDLNHRCTVCPKYSEIQAQHRPCVQRWSDFDSAFTHHCIVPRNEHLHSWWQHLQALPDLLLLHHVMPTPHETYDLFTDGSTFMGTTTFAHSAWAVVDLSSSRIVSGGPMWGIIQTNNRAELVAVLSALHWKFLAPITLRLWVDSSYVVNNFQHLLKTHSIPDHWTNLDLWAQALDLIRRVDWTTCSIHKVNAHADPDAAADAYEDWLCKGNTMADTAAKRFNMDRGSNFETLLSALMQRQQQLSRLATSQKAFLLDMAKYDLGQARRPSLDPEDLPISILCEQQEFNDCLIASVLEPTLSASLSWPGVDASVLRVLSDFLSGLDLLGSVKQPVSLHELVLGFEIQMQRAFPIRTLANGKDLIAFPAEAHLGALQRPTLAGSAATLRDIVAALFSFVHEEAPIVRQPRSCVGIHCVVSCLWIGWPGELSTFVFDRLQAFSPAVHKTQELARTYSARV